MSHVWSPVSPVGGVCLRGRVESARKRGEAPLCCDFSVCVFLMYEVVDRTIFCMLPVVHSRLIVCVEKAQV